MQLFANWMKFLGKKRPHSAVKGFHYQYSLQSESWITFHVSNTFTSILKHLWTVLRSECSRTNGAKALKQVFFSLCYSKVPDRWRKSGICRADVLCNLSPKMLSDAQRMRKESFGLYKKTQTKISNTLQRVNLALWRVLLCILLWVFLKSQNDSFLYLCE